MLVGILETTESTRMKKKKALSITRLSTTRIDQSLIIITEHSMTILLLNLLETLDLKKCIGIFVVYQG